MGGVVLTCDDFPSFQRIKNATLDMQVLALDPSELSQHFGLPELLRVIRRTVI
jgi:hypothetical protein